MCMYLHLFHGRTSPDERLSDWGSDGPWIGPLRAVRTTYAHTLKLEFCRTEDAAKFGLNVDQPWLHVREQMLLHGGVYYGEWEICARDALTISATPITPWSGPPNNTDWLAQAYDDRTALPDAEVCDA